jgi:hypothetical protein
LRHHRRTGRRADLIWVNDPTEVRVVCPRSTNNKPRGGHPARLLEVEEFRSPRDFRRFVSNLRSSPETSRIGATIAPTNTVQKQTLRRFPARMFVFRRTQAQGTRKKSPAGCPAGDLRLGTVRSVDQK